MDLHDYISIGKMTPTELARQIGVSPVLISQWKRRGPEGRKVPAEHCPKIERATAGEVRCEDLRPDIDWDYLRGTKPAPKAFPRSVRGLGMKEGSRSAEQTQVGARPTSTNSDAA